MFYNIQLLRAVAALMVVFDHWGDHYSGTLRQVGLLGSSGVDIFFVISGFVMVRSTWRRETSPWAFAINRIIRIVPLYWICTIVVLVGALVVPSAFRSTDAAVVPLLKSLAFIPYLKRSGLVQPLLFPGWTLNYEMFFYALFALSLFVRARVVRSALLVGVLVLLVLAGEVMRPSGVLAGFYTAPILLEFGFGALMGVGFGREAIPGSARWVGWVLLGMGFVGLLAMQPFFPGVDRGIKIGPFALLVVYAVLLLERSGVVARAGWSVLTGAASYALYLVHPFVGAVVFAAVGRLPFPSGVGIVLSAYLTFVFTIAAGLFVHLRIERPVDRWLRARFGSRPATMVSQPLAVNPAS